MSDLGLSIAASGIDAATAELDTASNNLANIATPGYARESVVLSPQAAAGPLQAGRGVTISSVTALADAVYQVADVAARGVSSAAGQSSQIMQSVESVFPEPDANGLAAQLSTLWSGLSNLAANPGQSGAAQAVASDAQTVADTLNTKSNELSQLAVTLQTQIGTGSGDSGTLAQANTLLTQIASLNQGIAAGNIAGQDVNALGTERRSAIDQLAGILGIRATTDGNGSTTVLLGGIQLVAGNVAQSLVATGSAATANLGIATSAGVRVLASGSIGANLAALNVTLPGYQEQLSAVANSLAGSLNSLQANGMAANGDPGSAIAGGFPGTVLPNIFVDQASATTFTAGPTSAATIAVSPALLADPTLLATASAPGPGNTNVLGTPTLDSTNAQAMAALSGSSTGPGAVYQGLIGLIGSDAAGASTAATAASNLATTATNNVMSVSGVNQNEEEVHILNAQNDFQALSKVISAIDASFQSLLLAV